MRPVNFASEIVNKVHRISSFKNVVQEIKQAQEGTSKPYVVSFINAHAFNILHTDEVFYEAMAASDILIRDGKGMEILYKKMKQDPGMNGCGTDLIPVMLEEFKDKSVALFGTDTLTLDKAADKMKSMGCNIVASANGFAKKEEYIEIALKTRPDIILLGMGMPKQEVLSLQLKTALQFPCMIINGGAIIDHYGNKVKRAPAFIRSLGAEWLYRLITEPRRLFKRYVVGNIEFFKRIKHLHTR